MAESGPETRQRAARDEPADRWAQRPAVRIRELGTPLRDVDAYDLKKTTPGDTDIARLRQAHVGAQFWSVWVPSTDDIKKIVSAHAHLA